MVAPPPGGTVVTPGAIVVVVAPGAPGVGAVVVVVTEGRAAAHDGRVNTSLFNVTAPFRARACPSTVTPLFTVTEVRARMFPTKLEPLPNVAELPTCQKTLQAVTPPTRFTVLSDAVMSVESVWKMNTASEPPFSVSVPVRPSEPLELVE